MKRVIDVIAGLLLFAGGVNGGILAYGMMLPPFQFQIGGHALQGRVGP
jgi:hypothetical protein